MSLTGLTLAELLLAAAILAFVLTGLAALFVNCIFLNEANRNLAIATSHAQYIAEEIRNTAFSSAESAINNGAWNLDSAQLRAAPYDLAALNSESIAASVFESGNPLGVAVTVNWLDRNSRWMNTELRTRLTNY
ncbi:MAG: hypothetical protein Q8N85_02500 [Candidatus Omnitrophota bacterium]|nr:hypothetical protein [Candidatus Omnitrophota bacterium]